MAENVQTSTSSKSSDFLAKVIGVAGAVLLVALFIVGYGYWFGHWFGSSMGAFCNDYKQVSELNTQSTQSSLQHAEDVINKAASDAPNVDVQIQLQTVANFINARLTGSSSGPSQAAVTAAGNESQSYYDAHCKS